jgi:hypothetical protein
VRKKALTGESACRLGAQTSFSAGCSACSVGLSRRFALAMNGECAANFGRFHPHFANRLFFELRQVGSG